MKNKGILIISSALLACAAMAYIESYLRPVYFIKSILKLSIFMLSIVICGMKPSDIFGKSEKRPLYASLILGFLTITAVWGGFALLERYIDFSGIVPSLMTKEGITAATFPIAALYIIFVNSLLEELLFRGLAYIELKKHIIEWVAATFSSLLFALYHIGIMENWVSLPLTALSVLSLFCAGWLFCLLDRKGSLIPSQLLHMSANIALNTVALKLFGII